MSDDKLYLVQVELSVARKAQKPECYIFNSEVCLFYGVWGAIWYLFGLLKLPERFFGCLEPDSRILGIKMPAAPVKSALPAILLIA